MSPVALEPVPTAYLPSFLALLPDSSRSHPFGRTLDSAASGVLVRVLKSCVYAAPKVVRLILPEPPDVAKIRRSPTPVARIATIAIISVIGLNHFVAVINLTNCRCLLRNPRLSEGGF